MKTHGTSTLLVLLVGSTAAALVAPPPPGPAKFARADAIVVGRIVAHEDKDIQAPLPGSSQKATYRIAVLKVTESIRGSEAGKTLRVAFMPPPMPQPGRPVLVTGGGGRVKLDVGQDGLFILTQHPDGFYQPPLFYNIVARSGANFDKEVSEAKRFAKLLDDPMAGLKSNEPKQRLETATLLIARYRTFLPGPTKQEPIDAEESKLILKAIAEADWQQKRKFGQMHPFDLFVQLGLTEKDGWKMPKDARNQEAQSAAAQAWLREHAASHRIQKIVAAK